MCKHLKKHQGENLFRPTMGMVYFDRRGDGIFRSTIGSGFFDRRRNEFFGRRSGVIFSIDGFFPGMAFSVDDLAGMIFSVDGNEKFFFGFLRPSSSQNSLGFSMIGCQAHHSE